MPELRTSVHFNAEEDKLVLKSNDGLLFRVDKQKLISLSPAFEAVLGMKVDPSESGGDAVVDLEEDFAVVSAFLRFTLHRPPLPLFSFEKTLQVLPAFKKYDVDVNSTLFCDQLYARFVEEHPAKVWAICANAGQEGLARACLAYFPDVVDEQKKRRAIDERGVAIMVSGRPFSPSDIPLEDLRSVPDASLSHLLKCYDRVMTEHETWMIAARRTK